MIYSFNLRGLWHNVNEEYESAALIYIRNAMFWANVYRVKVELWEMGKRVGTMTVRL